MLCLPNFRKHRKTTKREKKKKDRDRWPDTFSKRIDCESVSVSVIMLVFVLGGLFPGQKLRRGRTVFSWHLCAHAILKCFLEFAQLSLTSGPYTCYYLCLPGRSFLPHHSLPLLSFCSFS